TTAACRTSTRRRRPPAPGTPRRARGRSRTGCPSVPDGCAARTAGRCPARYRRGALHRSRRRSRVQRLSVPPRHALQPRVDNHHMTFGVYSEVGRLRQAIIHRPGLELSRLTPQNMGSLLFDDVLWAARAKQEHDEFAAALTSRGVQVHYFGQLLAETLEV